jgi:hypothetical protein
VRLKLNSPILLNFLALGSISEVSGQTDTKPQELKWVLQVKKSALRKIMVKYLCFWGGDFYSPPTKVLLMSLSNLSGDIISLMWTKYQTYQADQPTPLTH